MDIFEKLEKMLTICEKYTHIDPAVVASAINASGQEDAMGGLAEMYKAMMDTKHDSDTVVCNTVNRE